VRSTLDIAVRVEFMAHHAPTQAGNEISEDFDTLLYGCYLSIATDSTWRNFTACGAQVALLWRYSTARGTTLQHVALHYSTWRYSHTLLLVLQ
jgi:hypothetical protein